MTWTKLDDNFHSHPKIRRAWRNPQALGLHILALNFCTCHDLDGKVPVEFAEDMVPVQLDRDRAVAYLIECDMWKENGEGWVIHDFLEFQPSREKVRASRAKDAERKRKERGG